jgi:hypothetical protein
MADELSLEPNKNGAYIGQSRTRDTVMGGLRTIAAVHGLMCPASLGPSLRLLFAHFLIHLFEPPRRFVRLVDAMDNGRDSLEVAISSGLV